MSCQGWHYSGITVASSVMIYKYSFIELYSVMNCMNFIDTPAKSLRDFLQGKLFRVACNNFYKVQKLSLLYMYKASCISAYIYCAFSTFSTQFNIIQYS